MGLFSKGKSSAQGTISMSDEQQESFTEALLADLLAGQYPSFKQIMTIKQLRPDLRAKVDAALAEAQGEDPQDGGPSSPKLGGL